jgi:hypothetical protein
MEKPLLSTACGRRWSPMEQTLGFPAELFLADFDYVRYCHQEYAAIQHQRVALQG